MQEIKNEYVAIRVGGVGGGGGEVDFIFLKKCCQFDENLRVPLM